MYHMQHLIVECEITRPRQAILPIFLSTIVSSLKVSIGSIENVLLLCTRVCASCVRPRTNM